MHKSRLDVFLFSSLVLIFFSLSPIAQAESDLFAGQAGQPIAGNVLSNDGVTTDSARLEFDPRRGELRTPDGAIGIAANGDFVYTPTGEFQGLDAFVYSVEINGVRTAFQARLFSGAVQIISDDDPSQNVSVSSAANRTVAKLSDRTADAGSQWVVTATDSTLQFESQLSTNSSKVIETWQPNAAGTDITLYQRNRRPWQNFYLSRSRFGSDELRSQYTDFSLQRIDGELTAGVPDGTSKDDWIFAGADQVPPPSARDDRFTTPVDTQLDGNVLSNDDANSIDFASFLVTPPSNGQFVGINNLIYGGLAPFGSFNYQPNPGFEGADSFTYIALGSSNGAPSRLVTVNIRVGNLNQPVAGDDLFFVPADAVLSGRVLNNDSNVGGGFFDPQAVLVSEPRFGSFIGINQSIYGGLAPFGAFDYQPEAGFNGVDSFAYKILNSGEESKVATVFIVVGDVQFAPKVNWRLKLGTASAGNRSAFIIDNSDNLISNAFQIQQSAQSGQYHLGYAGKVLETWMPSASGQDASLYSLNEAVWQQFSFELADSGALRIKSNYTNRFLESGTTGEQVRAEQATSAVEQQWLIAGPQQAFGPTGRDDEFTMLQDSELEGRVLGNDDANGFDFLALPVTQPQNGNLVGLGQSIYDGITPWGAFTYQPNPGFVGEDTFVYQVLSSFNGAPSRYVTVKITVVAE